MSKAWPSTAAGLKMEEEPKAEGMWELLEAGKSKERDSSWSLWRETLVSQNLYSSLVRPTSIF